MKLKDVKVLVAGSHAYGTPKEGSDIDLVVLVSEEDLKILKESQPEAPTSEQFTSLRFGNLNLICCTSLPQFAAWVDGTRQLKEKAPVSRDTAVYHFAALRRERDLVNDY